MATARGLSWTQTKVTIGDGNGPWGASQDRIHDGVRLELLHNRQAGRIEARLFDRMGFPLEEAHVLEHSVDGATATIRTAEGETWRVAKIGDCGCG